MAMLQKIGGYIIYLENEKYQPIWIGCGYYEEYHNGFLIFLNPSQPIIRQWCFKKINILDQLIELAKKNLSDSDTSVSEIAYELGFEYPQYFSRLFKLKTGMTPVQFRNSARITH